MGLKKSNTICVLGDVRKQITVLFSACADGTVLNTFVLYNGKKLLEKWFDGTKNKVHIDRNKSGFMDPKMFKAYVEKVVLPHFEQQPKQGYEPMVRYYKTRLSNNAMLSFQGLIIVDGHWSHVKNIELVDMCRQRGVKILRLPSGMSATFQSLDKSVFGKLKKYWKSHQNDVDYEDDEVS